MASNRKSNGVARLVARATLLNLLIFSGLVYAHSGGLDSSGCHGGSRPYHCHRSSSEMVGNRLRCDLGSRSSECDRGGGSQAIQPEPKVPPTHNRTPSGSGNGSEFMYTYGAPEIPSSFIVKKIQERLKIEGLFKGEVDGKFGARTALAIDIFKIKNNLQSSGYFDEDTLHHLGVTDESK